jgi:hypothetical protein
VDSFSAPLGHGITPRATTHQPGSNGRRGRLRVDETRNRLRSRGRGGDRPRRASDLPTERSNSEFPMSNEVPNGGPMVGRRRLLRGSAAQKILIDNRIPHPGLDVGGWRPDGACDGGRTALPGPAAGRRPQLRPGSASDAGARALPPALHVQK